jgi:orotate phosphoribosyltransferase-like protein
LFACIFNKQFTQNAQTVDVGGEDDGPVGVDIAGDVGLKAGQVVDDNTGLVTTGRQIRRVVEALRVRGGRGDGSG